MTDINIKTQKYFGDKGLIIFIGLLSAFIPLSTDFYLPALPGMSDYFNESISICNLTLILFFIFYSIGLLFWGPVSDKYGRKTSLIIGLIIYIIASFGCVLSSDIWQLIFCRIFQAAGGSAATAISTAMVRDSYTGRKMESCLAIVQSTVLITPAVAPLIGAFLLPYTTWHGLFLILAGIGLFSLLGSLFLEDTYVKRTDINIFESFAGLFKILKNPGFSSLLTTFSLTNAASLAFVGGSAYIYQNEFGLSEQVYSYFFAFNAIALISGSLLYIYFTRYISYKTVIVSGFIVMIFFGTLIALFGNTSPVIFAVLLFPASLMTCCVRPGGTYLMLIQQDENVGSASSLINCFGLLFGCCGMVFVSLSTNMATNLGIINAVCGFACIVGWFIICKFGIAKLT